MVSTYIQNRPLYRDLRAWSLFMLAVGMALVFFPQRFERISSYRFLIDIFTTSLWGVLFIAVSLVVLVGIHYNFGLKGYKYVRLGIVAAASLFAMWGSAIFLAFFMGSSSTPIGVITYIFLIYVPFSLLKRDPFANPELRRTP